MPEGSQPSRSGWQTEVLHLGDAEKAFGPSRRFPNTYCGRSKLSVVYWCAPELDTPDFLANRRRCGACKRVEAARQRAAA